MPRANRPRSPGPLLQAAVGAGVYVAPSGLWAEPSPAGAVVERVGLNPAPRPLPPQWVAAGGSAVVGVLAASGQHLDCVEVVSWLPTQLPSV